MSAPRLMRYYRAIETAWNRFTRAVDRELDYIILFIGLFTLTFLVVLLVLEVMPYVH